jgi:hypothetical protein
VTLDFKSKLDTVLTKSMKNYTRSEKLDSERDAKSGFYSMLILIDMMAEYSGIVNSAFLIAVSQTAHFPV